MWPRTDKSLALPPLLSTARVLRTQPAASLVANMPTLLSIPAEVRLMIYERMCPQDAQRFNLILTAREPRGREKDTRNINLKLSEWVSNFSEISFKLQVSEQTINQNGYQYPCLLQVCCMLRREYLEFFCGRRVMRIYINKNVACGGPLNVSQLKQLSAMVPKSWRGSISTVNLRYFAKNHCCLGPLLQGMDLPRLKKVVLPHTTDLVFNQRLFDDAVARSNKFTPDLQSAALLEDGKAKCVAQLQDTLEHYGLPEVSTHEDQATYEMAMAVGKLRASFSMPPPTDGSYYLLDVMVCKLVRISL